MDFFEPIVTELNGRKIRVEANYLIKRYTDVMIKGGDFYAIWDESRGLWSTDINDAVEIIDESLFNYAKKLRDDAKYGSYLITVKSLTNSTAKGMTDFKYWYQKLAPDRFEWLDGKVIFANDQTTKSDYATFKLPYSLVEGDTPAWDELTNKLYSPEEKRKIEYGIGAVISGKSKELQKFFIFVGDAGTGKSTILGIINDMFKGYTSTIDVESIGMGKDFALETLSNNPLIAIQDDVELDRIEQNSRLNSIVSHEYITVNEKHKKQYQAKFRTMIFVGANREVRITDARSGLLRRIIDIEPTGEKFERRDYDNLMSRIPFEYGSIAYKCLKVFEEDPGYYNKYYPVKMIRATNNLYNYVEENYKDILDEDNGTSLSVAWENYKRYCELSDIKYPLDRLKFKIYLKDYFSKFNADTDRNGKRVYNYYSDFKFNKLGININKDTGNKIETWLKFEKAESGNFDILCEDCPAQYANDFGTPYKSWDNNDKILKSLDPTRLHYVQVPDNHIVIDFDIKDPETGEKSLYLNMEAANKFPPTYAELSKSGQGIHLHYIYAGDPKELSAKYDEDIEVKVYTGNSAVRRKLTQCVNLPIATINSGLPLKEKGENKMVSDFVVENDKMLHNMVMKCLNKEYNLGGTKPFVDYIYKLTEDAYKSGIQYDLTDLRPKILAFANGSSNHSEYCCELVSKMHFMSEPDADVDSGDCGYSEDAPIAFYDVEVLPNLFVVVYKLAGEDSPCIKLINPSPDVIRDMCKLKLIGFNNRKYDNHILYARMLGYSEYQLYKLSKRIIEGSPNATFLNAYNLSYTDVYDMASNPNKMGLKKWEIKLDIHHLELGLNWDEEVPEELWDKVADYCCNDVISTEKVFDHIKGDWMARQILAELSDLTVNHTTNQHSTKIIFNGVKRPQVEFLYRDLSKPVKYLDPEVSEFLWDKFPEMMKWWSENTDSLLPYFPGYTFENGKSYYKGVEVGEGGYVEALQGIFGNVGLFDVASMHPHSMLAECLFGPKYTAILRDLVEARIAIKHKDWDYLSTVLDGKLVPYISRIKTGEIRAKDLSNALKTVINSIYGLTSAKFENAFRDIRNKDNIVAKRGALFMLDLAEAVRNEGYLVAHIKTDSMKIPDVTERIWEFVKEFGLRYGYTFEWEATYDKMCLINDAVYIARYSGDEEHEFELPTGEVIKTNWTATGQRFAEPYVFKTLFSNTPLVFKDYCQTKNVAKGNMYLDMNEDLSDGEHNYIFVGKTGSFVPIVKGQGAGELVVLNNEKYGSVTGAKGYRWMDAEMVKNGDMVDVIDISYFEKLADEAKAKIEEYGYFDYFVSPTPYDGTVPFGTEPVDNFMNQPQDDDDTPPWDEK